jgi:hypothetical protein
MSLRRNSPEDAGRRTKQVKGKGFARLSGKETRKSRPEEYILSDYWPVKRSKLLEPRFPESALRRTNTIATAENLGDCSPVARVVYSISDTIKPTVHQTLANGEIGYARMRGVFVLHLRALLATIFSDSSFPFGQPARRREKPLCMSVQRELAFVLQPVLIIQTGL